MRIFNAQTPKTVSATGTETRRDCRLLLCQWRCCNHVHPHCRAIYITHLLPICYVCTSDIRQASVTQVPKC